MSIIKQLRAKDKDWKAVRDGFGWRWKHPNGQEIRAYAQSAPRYDGDDDSWETVYYDEKQNLVGSNGIIF